MDPNCIPAARRHGGAFTAQEAREHVRWERLHSWVEGGLIVRESRKVFRLVTADTGTAARIARAELVIGQPLIACHHSSANLHGFDVLPASSIHVTTADARSIKAPPGVVVHQLKLRSPAVEVNGTLTANRADTAVDLAAAAEPIDGLAILDGALRAGIGGEELLDAIARARGMRGIIGVRDQLPRANAFAESPMESRARFRLYEAGLPQPELQIIVPIRGGGYRKLDMGWRAARVGLEFDGQDFHSGDGSLDRDRQRGAELIEAGWTVVHVTAADIYRRPGKFTGVLRDLLKRKAS